MSCGSVFFLVTFQLDAAAKWDSETRTTMFARDNYADSQDFEILIQYSRTGGGSSWKKIRRYVYPDGNESRGVAPRCVKKRARNPYARSPYPIKYTHRGPRSFVTGAPRLGSHRSVHLGKEKERYGESGERIRRHGAKERKKTRHLCLVEARGGPDPVGPLGWSRGRPRR